jgi:hypothetical protein
MALGKFCSDPPEVLAYRSLVAENQIAKPSCRHKNCSVQRWGLRYRSDVRLDNGLRLAQIPIPRFVCTRHGEISWLPDFLCATSRYLASVVETRMENIQTFLRAGQTNPSRRTLSRWWTHYTRPDVHSRLVEWLSGLGVDFLQSVASKAGPRTSAELTVHYAKLLRKKLNSQSPSCCFVAKAVKSLGPS